MRIIIPYQPRNWSKKLHSSTKRWNVFILHRRAGKTVATLNHLQRSALQIPNSKYAFIAPTYKQAKDIAWDLLKYYSQVIPGKVYNESELRVDYPNGSRIRLYGADNPDALRGIALWGVVFDEYSQQPANIFGEIISKALADNYGYAIWIGTIKGRNHLYQMYERAKKENEWITHWQNIDTTIATESGQTIENLKRALEDDKKLVEQGIMTDEEFKQEWYLDVDASIKGAVYAKEWTKLKEHGRLCKIDYDPLLPTYSAWDFGIGDATAIGIYQIQPSIKREVRLIDYYENNNQNLQHYLEWLKNKPYKLTMSYGDPSGQNKNLNTGRSLFEDLNSTNTTNYLGYPIRMFARKTRVIDKIHTAKRLFNELWVDERLDKFIAAVTNYHYTWDEKRGEFQEEPYHDWSSHAMDQLGYFAVNFLTPHIVDPIQQRINKIDNTFDITTDFYANKI